MGFTMPDTVAVVAGGPELGSNDIAIVGVSEGSDGSESPLLADQPQPDEVSGTAVGSDDGQAARPHQLKTSADCDCARTINDGRCNICDYGLGICKVCGRAEAQLDEDGGQCPGQPPTADVATQVSGDPLPENVATMTASDSPITAVTIGLATSAETEAAIAEFERELQSAQRQLSAAAIEQANYEQQAKAAKADVKAIVQLIRRLIDRGPKYPEAKKGASQGAADASTATADTSPLVDPAPPTAPAADPNAWRKVSVEQLGPYGLKPATIEKLIESGLETIGQLEDRRADISQGREKWPKGIGKAKVTDIENAVIGWLADNPIEAESTSEQPADPRDIRLTCCWCKVNHNPITASELESLRSSGWVEIQDVRSFNFQVVEGVIGDCWTHNGICPQCATKEKPSLDEQHPFPGQQLPPTADEDESAHVHDEDHLTDEQRDQAINDRADELDTGKEDALLSKHPESDGMWQSGREARRAGALITDCLRSPGVDRDDWLRGWMFEDDRDGCGPAEAAAATATAEESGYSTSLDDL